MVVVHPRRAAGRCTQLTPNPTADPAIAADNQSWFPWFLGVLPADLRRDRHRQRVDVQDDPGDLADRGRAGHRRRHTPERAAALAAATKQSSAALGVIGAVGAIGGFLIPIAFGSPWVDDPLSATKGAFVVFTCFYVVCAVVTYAVYLRRPAEARPPAWRRAGV